MNLLLQQSSCHSRERNVLSRTQRTKRASSKSIKSTRREVVIESTWVGISSSNLTGLTTKAEPVRLSASRISVRSTSQNWTSMLLSSKARNSSCSWRNSIPSEIGLPLTLMKSRCSQAQISSSLKYFSKLFGEYGRGCVHLTR